MFPLICEHNSPKIRRLKIITALEKSIYISSHTAQFGLLYYTISNTHVAHVFDEKYLYLNNVSLVKELRPFCNIPLRRDVHHLTGRFLKK